MHNALTIDVEDYYMVSAFSDTVKFEDWKNHESRVERSTYRLLELLDTHHVKATFFTLGWIAEQQPALVRDIIAAGHELACHGYNHRLIYDLTRVEFREDVKRAKGCLEDAGGTAVIGYRGASYSIVKKSLWALDILAEEGFRYDSSIFPVHHDRYGIPGAERFPHTIDTPTGSLVEFPISTYPLFGQNMPFSGGGYLRLLPLQLLRRAITHINIRERNPVVLYLHPWEIDVEQPRLKGSWKSKARHYLNLSTTLPKLQTLLNEFSFKPLSGFLK